jgi:hypothetical protein
MAYARNGEFNILYPTRRKVANVLKKIILEESLIDTRTLYDSIRINAKVSTEGNLRIQIVAAYYFGFLNNGTITIAPYNLLRQFDAALDADGIYAEIWGGYTEYLTTKYPILEIGNILDRGGDILFSFEPLFGEFYGELDY